MSKKTSGAGYNMPDKIKGSLATPSKGMTKGGTPEFNKKGAPKPLNWKNPNAGMKK